MINWSSTINNATDSLIEGLNFFIEDWNTLIEQAPLLENSHGVQYWINSLLLFQEAKSNTSKYSCVSGGQLILPIKLISRKLYHTSHASWTDCVSFMSLTTH